MGAFLITGFEPFLENKENPSQIVAHEVSQKFSLDFQSLPVSFEQSWAVLEKVLQQKNYDHILLLGLASLRNRISIERVAINWRESEFPDNDGVIKSGEKINFEQPAAYVHSMPIGDWVIDLKNQGIPAEVSFSAGAYLCNEVYFRTCFAFPKSKVLFVHLPPFSVIPKEKQIQGVSFIQQALRSM